jgi:hypothetical protein
LVSRRQGVLIKRTFFKVQVYWLQKLLLFAMLREYRKKWGKAINHILMISLRFAGWLNKAAFLPCFQCWYGNVLLRSHKTKLDFKHFCLVLLYPVHRKSYILFRH